MVEQLHLLLLPPGESHKEHEYVVEQLHHGHHGEAREEANLGLQLGLRSLIEGVAKNSIQ